MNDRLIFVMEQGLGHVVHTLNLERALGEQTVGEGTVVRVRPGQTDGVTPLPFTRNWSIQMSWAARCALRTLPAAGEAKAVFVHTQVAALLLKSIMARVPSVISLDATPLGFDSMAEAYRHDRQSAPLEWIKLQANRRALRNASGIVTWSRWAKKSVVSDYGIPSERVHAISPGVVMSDFRVGQRRLTSNPVRLLFVGGDFQRKGGPDLEAAMRLLGGIAELDVVTSQQEHPTPGAPGIRFHHGVAPNSPELHRLYAQADVFVLPSRGDCTPLVIAEAMASGLPVVATDVGALPELVSHGSNGLVVPAQSPRELAEALRSLVSDIDMRRRMGIASRAIAEADHDAIKNWKRIFALLEDVAAERSAASGTVAVAAGPAERMSPYRAILGRASSPGSRAQVVSGSPESR